MDWQRDDPLTPPSLRTPRLGSPIDLPAASAYRQNPYQPFQNQNQYQRPYQYHPPPPPPPPTPSTALLNANSPYTRYVRFLVTSAGTSLDAVGGGPGAGERIVVAGKDVLKILRLTNRLPSFGLPSSPSSPNPSTSSSSTARGSSLALPAQPVQRSLSDRGHSRRGKSKVVGPGGSTAEEVVNVWSGSKLGLTYSVMDVAWGHQNYSEKLVTACMNGDCVLWDLQKPGNRVETFLHEHQRTVNRVQFSPNHPQYVLSGSKDGTCKLWDLRKPMSSVSTFRCNASVYAVAFSPLGGSSDFVAGLGNGAIQRFDYRMEIRGMVDWVSSAHSSTVLDLKWRDVGASDESGTWLASCGMDKFVKIWDMEPASPSASFGPPRENSYDSFAATGGGAGLAAGTGAETGVGMGVEAGLAGPGVSVSGSLGGSGAGTSYTSSGSTLSSGTGASGSSHSGSGGAHGIPYNKPRQVLRTASFNRRVCWRPGCETELVVVPMPYLGGGVGGGGGGAGGAGVGGGGGSGGGGGAGAGAGKDLQAQVEDAQMESAKITVWDVRRNYVPKYVLEGGTTVPTDVLFMENNGDALVATYRDSHVVQHDFRHHSRPIDSIERNALSWDGAGRLAFAVEEKGEGEGLGVGEIPFDEPPYDRHTRMRTQSRKEHSVKGPRFLPAKQVAAGMLVPSVDADAFVRMAHGYVLSGAERWELCAANAAVADDAGHVQAAQAWQMLHALLAPLPMPSRSPSPLAQSTPGGKSSKYSYSPISGSSKRATSAGPRPKGRRGPASRQMVRPPAGRRATVVGAGVGAGSARDGDRSGYVSGEAGQQVGEGTLEDSDSDGSVSGGITAGSGSGAGNRRPTRASPVQMHTDDRTSAPGSAQSAGHHTRNQNSESSLSSGVGASMRSPLSRTPVTADQLVQSGLRRLSEMTEEDEDEGEEGDGDEDEMPLSPVVQTDPETGNEDLDAGSSSSAAEGGLMLRRGKLPQTGRVVSGQYGQFHSSHGTRRNSLESESTNHVRGHRHTLSNGSTAASATAGGRNGAQKNGKPLSASPRPLQNGAGDALARPRRSRREIIEAEQRIREKGWDAMRIAFEGMMLEGDVQTCAVMALVMGEQLVKEEGRAVRMVTAYLDMLSRLQLFTAAAEVRKYFKAPEVQDITNSATLFASSCARCGKALRGQLLQPGSQPSAGNFAYCKTCNRAASRCAICHLPSKGLFFLCPTCGHGGHEECYREYYLSHPMDNVHIFLQTTQVLPPHTLRGNRRSITDIPGVEEEDRTGRTLNQKKWKRGPGRVHPLEAADDTEDEAQKERFWDRKRKVGKRVLLGHPCVAGCGHVCWVANDRIDVDGK